MTGLPTAKSKRERDSISAGLGPGDGENAMGSGSSVCLIVLPRYAGSGRPQDVGAREKAVGPTSVMAIIKVVPGQGKSMLLPSSNARAAAHEYTTIDADIWSNHRATLATRAADTAAAMWAGKRSQLLLLPSLSLWLLLGSLRLPAAAGGSHIVTGMRGFDGPLPFYLETGYVEVDERHGVHLFYYFARSEKDPDEDPLVLWLSGGPGCSGISGLGYEIGPFQFDTQGYTGGFPTLLYRPETWTKVSNIIFVDSPVGTGFSYAESEEGLKTGDTKAVKHLVIFLRKWLQDHPRFQSNPLYIAGDSYSGMIIPSLTLEIDRNIELGEKIFFNLKGYIAGNPVTDKQFDTDGKISFFHGMGLVSYELYENARENCGGKYSDPCNDVCAEAVQAIYNCTRDINLQHILEPACPDELWSPKTDGMSRLMLESPYFLSGFKCKKAAYYLSYIWGNDEIIQESLGVRKGTIGAWKRFNRELPYTHDIQSAVEYHSRLATKGYATLIYSGDHDALISPVGTQAWIRYLNLTIVDDWRPWYVGGQIAGFTRSYSSGLTFATVKGGGHTAPEYKPLECQAMFIRWISQDPL